MANKQTIAAPHLGGEDLLQQVHFTSVTPVLKRENEDDFLLSTAGTAIRAQKQYLKQTNTIKNDNFRLKADTVLNVCREQLYQAQTNDDFDEVVNNTPLMLESCFDGSDEEKNFWQEHGENLLNAHKIDVENIRAKKDGEFEQNNLEQMLLETQKVLGETPLNDAENILEQGVAAIEQTEHLSRAEKQTYRQKYLTGSILNLALQNANEAEKARQQYLPDDEDLKSKLSKVRELTASYEKQVKEEQVYQHKMAQLNEAVQLWQSLERKEINPAKYYVLSQLEGNLPLLEDDGKYLQAPIVAVYRALRQNGSKRIEAEQLREWQNYLVSAYRQDEIDLDNVVWWQNNLLSKAQSKQKILDDELCAQADKKFGEDKDERTPEALAFMEKKAKFVFGILPDIDKYHKTGKYK